MSINIFDFVTFGMSHNTFGNTVPNTFFRSDSKETMLCAMKGYCLVDFGISHYLFEIAVSGLIG